ncbi:MAG: hypothetical protein EOO61_05805 [Hymenobacter sp.]|nr:MAG: hypothetical protein EOO61_05805 [Hymenobacter sp.]
MKFKSEKSLRIALVLYGAVLLLGYCSWDLFHHTQTAWKALSPLLPAFLLLWIWLDTGYEIKNACLYYRSGPVSGSIDVARIHTVTSNDKRFYLGVLKPALSVQGCIIQYNRYDQIYLSPEDQLSFLTELTRINPGIVLSFNRAK